MGDIMKKVLSILLLSAILLGSVSVYAAEDLVPTGNGTYVYEVENDAELVSGKLRYLFDEVKFGDVVIATIAEDADRNYSNYRDKDYYFFDVDEVGAITLSFGGNIVIEEFRVEVRNYIGDSRLGDIIFESNKPKSTVLVDSLALGVGKYILVVHLDEYNMDVFNRYEPTSYQFRLDFQSDTPATPPISNADSGDLNSFKNHYTYDDNKFSDVNSGDWYYSDVKTAFELGLMNGSSDTSFNSDGNLSIAEAITLAARIHKIYYTGDDSFSTSSPWYQTYVDYALDNKIISDTMNYANAATRKEFAEIIFHALPESELRIINDIPDGAIPDVSIKNSTDIYLLYRAGILTGSDVEGFFHPHTTITRSSVATIATRLVKPEARKYFALTLEMRQALIDLNTCVIDFGRASENYFATFLEYLSYWERNDYRSFDSTTFRTSMDASLQTVRYNLEQALLIAKSNAKFDELALLIQDAIGAVVELENFDYLRYDKIADTNDIDALNAFSAKLEALTKEMRTSSSLVADKILELSQLYIVRE